MFKYQVKGPSRDVKFRTIGQAQQYVLTLKANGFAAQVKRIVPYPQFKHRANTLEQYRHSRIESERADDRNDQQW
jgi:hypothetical protein